VTEQREAEDAAVAWIARLAAHDASAGDRAAFESWLSNDRSHAAAYAAMTELWQTLRPVARRAAAVHTSARRRRSWATPVALAAILMLAAGTWMWTMAPTVIETAVGEQRSIALVDGSHVELNTATHIELSARASQRGVRLQYGEAHFDVARDTAHPFKVTTPHGTVTVLGTSFNVRVRDRDTTVDVFEGSVDVRSSAAGMALTAGEGAVVELGAEPVPHGAPPPAWHDGRLLYRDVTLAELIADLDRYLPAKLVLADDAPTTQRITASLRLADQTEMLDALAEVVPLRYTQVNPELIIVRAG